MNQRVTGAILAGGKSSRMHQDKGLIDLEGKPMIMHVVETLQVICDPIFIVANNKAYENFGVPVYKDLVMDKGALGGLYTALETSETNATFLIACDVPHLSGEVLELLLEQLKGFEAAVPVQDSHIHPVCGIYSKNCLMKVKLRLEDTDLSMHGLLCNLNCNYLTIDKEHELYDKDMFRNYNKPADMPSPKPLGHAG